MRQLISILYILFLLATNTTIAQDVSVLDRLQFNLGLGGEYLHGDVVGLSGLLHDGRIKRDTKDKVNLSYRLGLNYLLTKKTDLGFVYKTGNVSGSVRDFNINTNRNYSHSKVTHISIFADRYILNSTRHLSSNTGYFIRAGGGLSFSEGEYTDGHTITSYKHMDIPHVVLGLGFKQNLRSRISLTWLFNTYLMFSDKVDGIVSSLGGDRDMIYSMNIGVNVPLSTVFNRRKSGNYRKRENEVLYSDNSYIKDSLTSTITGIKQLPLEGKHIDSLGIISQKEETMIYKIIADTSYSIRTNYNRIDEGDEIHSTKCLHREITQDTIYFTDVNVISTDSTLSVQPLISDIRTDAETIVFSDSSNKQQHNSDYVIDTDSLFTKEEHIEVDISSLSSDSIVEVNSFSDSLGIVKEYVVTDTFVLNPEIPVDTMGIEDLIQNRESTISVTDSREMIWSVDSLFEVYLLDTLPRSPSIETSRLELKKTSIIDPSKSSLAHNSSFKYSLSIMDMQNVFHNIDVVKIFHIKYDSYMNTEVKQSLKDLAVFMRKSNIESCIIVSNQIKTTDTEIKFMQNLFKTCHLQHNIPAYKFSLYSDSINTSILKSVLIYVTN